MKTLSVLIVAGLILAVFSSIASAGLVAHWSFDNQSDPYHDDSGHGYNGSTDKDPTWENGYLSFDGVDDYVDFGTEIGNFGTGDFSVIFSMRTDTDREETVMGKRVFCGVHKFFEIAMSEPVAPLGKMFVEVYESSNNNNSFDSIQRLDDDNWHQVAIIRKGFDVHLYLDGELDASDNTGQVADVDNSASFLLGTGPCVPAIADFFSFSGDLDEIYIYDYAIPEPVLVVEIDIKPGSYPNAINLGSHGLTPVAIFSMVGFDATSVDPNTVHLAGAPVATRGKTGEKFMAHEEDVDGDGMVDLVVQVVTADIDPALLQQDGDVIYAVLTGNTSGGEAIEGEDEIIIVPPK